MKKITLAITDDLMAQMGLTAGADEMAVVTAIKDLTVKAAKVDTIQKQLVTAQQKNTELETEVENLKNAGNEEKVKEMLTAAVTAQKLTVEVSKQLEKDYKTNPTGLKTLLEGMGAYSSIVGQIQLKGKVDNSKYDGKSWDELFESNQIEAFKRDNPEGYDKLYKETFPG